MKPVLMNHPGVIWHTYPERIFSLLPEPERETNFSITTHVLVHESYDNHVRQQFPVIGKASPLAVAALIEQQINGTDGLLKLDGSDNIMFLAGKYWDLYALRARYGSFAHTKAFGWLLTLSEVPRFGRWPDWGAYRPAGTQYLWETITK